MKTTDKAPPQNEASGSTVKGKKSIRQRYREEIVLVSIGGMPPFEARIIMPRFDIKDSIAIDSIT
jgi:hypothetical protein